VASSSSWVSSCGEAIDDERRTAGKENDDDRYSFDGMLFWLGKR
jgi:hypothetical protein